MSSHDLRRIADALEELVLLVKNYTFDDSEFSGVEPVRDFAARMDSSERETTDRERMLLSQLTESQARERELENEAVRLNHRLMELEIDAKEAADVDAD